MFFSPNRIDVLMRRRCGRPHSMPSKHAMPVVKEDYAVMRNMIYGDYPSSNEILFTIKKLE